tara:strand:- start:5241 stop:5876 length:636 start_codon:yes stop_codon:yes gene_type:complete
MKDNSILNKVRELLGIEIKLEQRKLEDGVTIIEADSFEAGAEVVIVTEDEQKIALPKGEYTLEDEKMLVVAEEGVIAEIKEAKEKEEEDKANEEKAKKEEEEEMIEEEVEASEEAKPIKKTVESIVKETFFSEMEELKKENEELKAKLEKLSKEQTVEETQEEVVELSQEVEAAAKPITHNPENKKKIDGFKYSKNRNKSTLDRVMEKLSK